MGGYIYKDVLYIHTFFDRWGKRQDRVVVLPVLARAAALVDVVSASAACLATVAPLTPSADDLY